MLLGVLSRPDGPGARALAGLGVTLGKARAQVMRIVGLPETPSPPELPLTPPARDALAGSLREAIELGETEAGAEHVLLALLRERDSVAVRVLRDAGVDARRLREAIAAAASEPRGGARRRRRPRGGAGGGGRAPPPPPMTPWAHTRSWASSPRAAPRRSCCARTASTRPPSGRCWTRRPSRRAPSRPSRRARASAAARRRVAGRGRPASG